MSYWNYTEPNKLTDLEPDKARKLRQYNRNNALQVLRNYINFAENKNFQLTPNLFAVGNAALTTINDFFIAGTVKRMIMGANIKLNRNTLEEEGKKIRNEMHRTLNRPIQDVSEFIVLLNAVEEIVFGTPNFFQGIRKGEIAKELTESYKNVHHEIFKKRNDLSLKNKRKKSNNSCIINIGYQVSAAFLYILSYNICDYEMTQAHNLSMLVQSASDLQEYYEGLYNDISSAKIDLRYAKFNVFTSSTHFITDQPDENRRNIVEYLRYRRDGELTGKLSVDLNNVRRIHERHENSIANGSSISANSPSDSFRTDSFHTAYSHNHQSCIKNNEVSKRYSLFDSMPLEESKEYAADNVQNSNIGLYGSENVENTKTFFYQNSSRNESITERIIKIKKAVNNATDAYIEWLNNKGCKNDNFFHHQGISGRRRAITFNNFVYQSTKLTQLKTYFIDLVNKNITHDEEGHKINGKIRFYPRSYTSYLYNEMKSEFKFLQLTGELEVNEFKAMVNFITNPENTT